MCRLLTGSLSDEVIGKGFDFLQNEAINMELATVIEDVERIPVELDQEKTGKIYDIVNNRNM